VCVRARVVRVYFLLAFVTVSKTHQFLSRRYLGGNSEPMKTIRKATTKY